MTRRHPQGQFGLEARMLTVMALVGLVYTGIGWGLHLLGMPTTAIIVLAGAVLAAQWLGSERFALAATKARLVDPAQAPALHAILDRLCALTGQAKPRLAGNADPAPNAFAVGRSRRHAVIVITRGLRQLEPREVEAVLAHELAHIDHGDIAVMTIASAWALAMAWVALTIDELTRKVLGPLDVGIALLAMLGAVVMGTVSAIAYLPVCALSRYRELAADRTAAMQLGQPALLASVLAKLQGGSGAIPREDLRDQSVPMIGFVAGPDAMGGLFSTHPTLASRLAQLNRLQIGPPGRP
jgi:heat shock protein HtpX